jgi:acetyl-CoA carboxylase beta subunit
MGLLKNLIKRSSAMSNDPSTKKEVNGFCDGIQALFQKAQEICNSNQVISSAKQLEKLEQKVCDLADQLQAIIIEKRLQASLDSGEVRETEADLAANLPWKLKNKGLRDVVRNEDEITSSTMHHSFRPPLPDLKSQKHQNSLLFLQLL